MNSNSNKLNKILNNLNNKEYINELLNNINKKEYKIKFIINKKPENYVRERSGRGKHFYNPKCSNNHLVLTVHLNDRQHNIHLI